MGPSVRQGCQALRFRVNLYQFVPFFCAKREWRLGIDRPCPPDFGALNWGFRALFVERAMRALFLILLTIGVLIGLPRLADWFRDGGMNSVSGRSDAALAP